MSRGLLNVRRATVAWVALALIACSGNDAQTSREIDLSASQLSFAADSPFASAPAAQVLTVSLGANAANVTALKSGKAIASVSVVVEGRSARVTVTPAAPTALGAGDFTGSLAISAYYCGDAACSRLEAGPARSASVAYRVSPIVTDIAPSAAIAGVSASVIIRGGGFNAFPPQGVSFGTTAATSISLVSDTEVRATYPALSAGVYPVTLAIATHPEPIVSEAQLAVVDPLAYPAQTLAWPAMPTRVHSLEYDARRRALFAATDASGGTLVRYAYSEGAWQTSSAAIPSLRDAALTTDGQQLLTISDTAAALVDPVTLAVGEGIQAPSLPAGSHLRSIAFLNTNQAFITSATGTYTATPLYGFVVRTGSLTQQALQFYNGTLEGSKNQALATLTQSDPTQATTSFVYLATASSGSFGASSITLNQNAVPAALDRDATRIVLNGTNVYDSQEALYGTLPATTTAVALSPDGHYVYTYDSAANALLTFDVSKAVENAAAFTPIGSPVPLVAAPGSGLVMIVSDDGSTLFLAGTQQLVVQPVPTGA